MAEPDAFGLVRAVLDPVRLAVLGASVGGAVSIATVAEELEIEPRDVAAAVGSLRAAGLLTAEARLDVEALRSIARELPRAEPDLGRPVEGPWTEDEAIVLGRFFAGTRLVELPSNTTKRRLVLERIAQEFEPGRRYSERDVNFMIQMIYADYAAIRRYLVDEGFMDRADGAYWRTGGRYDVPEDPEPIRSPLRIDVALDGVAIVAYTEDRIEELLAAAGDERIHRYMSDRFPHPYTRSDAEDWLALTVGKEPVDDFLIEVDGVLRGGVGAVPGKGEKEGTAEIGWWLHPDWWGRGITTAAATALVRYLFGDRGLVRVWAPVMAPNLASARVAEKIGMRLEGRAPDAYVKHDVRYDELDFGMTRSAWDARNDDG